MQHKVLKIKKDETAGEDTPDQRKVKGEMMREMIRKHDEMMESDE